ncbi:MAG: glycosyltransferase [Muribaculaceae bacterium]|jgi:putative colanic acid biosynthesis glycosyltransferase|nr:glycosyltransferase [Muribaculaceae bacterium]
MKKLLQINTVAGKGSIGYITDEIARTFMRNSGEVYIAAGQGRSLVDGVQFVKIGNRIDEYAHALFTRLNDSHGLHSDRATSNLIEEIIRIQPQIIHVHNVHGYYLNFPMLFSFLKKTEIPVVMTMHDSWMITGHCTSPIYSECQLYRDASCHDCPQHGSYPKSYIDRSKRNITIKKEILSDFKNLFIVTGSEWMSELVHESWLGSHPIFTIPNGINTDVFRPLHDVQRKRVLGVANVWHGGKGLDDFLRLRELLPYDYEMMLVGLGKRQISMLPHGITGLGHIDHAQLALLYDSALVTVNMSRSESFGMTIIESMACGTPVISFDNTSPHEIITPSCGRLVPNGDVKAVADAVDEIDKAKMTGNCRKEVIDKYSSSIMTENYMKLYNNIS